MQDVQIQSIYFVLCFLATLKCGWENFRIIVLVVAPSCFHLFHLSCFCVHTDKGGGWKCLPTSLFTLLERFNFQITLKAPRGSSYWKTTSLQHPFCLKATGKNDNLWINNKINYLYFHIFVIYKIMCPQLLLTRQYRESIFHFSEVELRL